MLQMFAFVLTSSAIVAVLGVSVLYNEDYGGIAISDVDYSYKNSKKHQILQEDLEHYKKEVLEGLQIKKEDVSKLITKKTKQPNGKIFHTDYLHTTNYKYNGRAFSLNNDKNSAVASKIRNIKDEDDVSKIGYRKRHIRSNNSFPESRGQRTRKNNKSNDYNVSNAAHAERLLLPIPQVTPSSDELPVNKFEPNFDFKSKQRANVKLGQTDPNVSKFGENQEKQLHHRATRAATAEKEKLWDYGVVPYEIDGNFTREQKTLFKKAMMHWEISTCLKFVERDLMVHPNYLIFTVEDCGCCSSIGKEGNGAQTISFADGCDVFGTVVHELGHTLGFDHEQSRPDRDNHVIVLEDNIRDGYERNFEKLSEKKINSLGMPYDYGSIMHYRQGAFGKDNQDTILPIPVPGREPPKIGQRVGLSEGDIAQTNLLYKCPKCGQTFQANSATFSSPSHLGKNNSQESEQCEWRITATPGERIILNITEIDIPDCRTDYIEIRDGYWHKSELLGKFCGTEKIHHLIISTGSRMLVTYVSKKPSGHRGFTANYKAICGEALNTETDGHLESPNFPEDYHPNKECIWQITVPDHHQVALKFQSFKVENHYPYCFYDYVEVRDGLTMDSPLIGVYCGYQIPPDILSSSNYLLVKFVSDGSVQKAGFSATFVVKEIDESNMIDHGSVKNPLEMLLMRRRTNKIK